MIFKFLVEVFGEIIMVFWRYLVVVLGYGVISSKYRIKKLKILVFLIIRDPTHRGGGAGGREY